jgi:hypothetical protein
MRKAIALLAVAFIIGTGAIGSSASAADWPDDCGSGRVCLYDYNNFDTQLGWKSTGFALTDISATNNDRMASWANHTSKNGAWYSNASGGGDCTDMNSGVQNAALGILSRDKASSWRGNKNCQGIA